MAKTLRSMLHSIQKAVEDDPTLLDLPVVASHSASDGIEGLYGPYLEDADEEMKDVVGNTCPDKVWVFTIDH